MKKINKTWGYEEILTENDKYKAKMLYIDDNKSIHLQLHTEKDETMYILEGNGYIIHGHKFESIAPGDKYRIKPGAIHKVWGDNGLKIFEISNLVSDDDIIHLEKFNGE